jgi:hypothetical protein
MEWIRVQTSIIKNKGGGRITAQEKKEMRLSERAKREKEEKQAEMKEDRTRSCQIKKRHWSRQDCKRTAAASNSASLLPKPPLACTTIPAFSARHQPHLSRLGKYIVLKTSPIATGPASCMATHRPTPILPSTTCETPVQISAS